MPYSSDRAEGRVLEGESIGSYRSRERGDAWQQQNRPLLLLDDASYSIYLWQLFPMLLVFRLGERPHVAPAILAAVTILVVPAGGIIAYLLLERPLLRLLHRHRTRRGVTIPAGP